MSLKEQFIIELKNAIESDQLTLPTLPEVALKIRQATEQEEIGLRDLTQVIAQDVALSARIMKVANSPLMRTSNSIDNLGAAVNRMGISYVRNLATGFAMQQMFQATHDLIDRYLRQVWQESAQTAAIATVLSAHFTTLPVDQASLAGLIHQIGVLPVLTWAEEKDDILALGDQTLTDIIEETAGEIGALILKKWHFSGELSEVPRQYQQWTRTHTGPPDFIDVVMVAHVYSHENQKQHPSSRIPKQEIQAFQKLGLDPHWTLKEIPNIQEEISASIQAFL